MSALPSIARIAELLGGEVSTGNQVRAPGPGHSPQDRSLSIKIDSNALDGFLVKSFADDDVIACKDYVRQKIGLPAFEPKRKAGKAGKRAAKPFSPTVARYTYKTADGQPYLQVQKTAAKEFYQYHWDGEQWIKGKPKGAKVPYRLSELLTAPLTAPVYICEGEKDCDNLAKIGFVATCNSEGADIGKGVGAGKKWTPDLNPHFKDRNCYILPDNDVPGRKHARHVAHNLAPVAASIHVVELPGLANGGDVSDWLESDPTGARLVRECKAAPVWDPAQSQGEAGDERDRERIKELATLGRLAYAKQRRSAAERMEISVVELDAIVKEAKREAADEEFALPHWAVEPWDGEVAGAELLEDLKATFTKYIVLPAGTAVAAALWVLHAWTMDAGDVSPFLVLVSPTKRCGKTNMLIVLLYLTPRSELASNISASALYRYIEDIRPTLLIDEADSFVGAREEMRGILDSGHTRVAAGVIRNVESNGEHKPRRFSTWAPKAIAAIKSLADTLEDRAVIVRLQRKPKTAKVERLRKRDCKEFAILRRKAARWAEVHYDELAADPDPAIPDELDDRAADNWRPLLAIADLAGGDWPRRARDAACLLSGVGHESASTNVELLADIKLAFGDADEIRSVDLVAKLVADPEKSWAEYKDHKPLTQRQLGGLLRAFQIVSETVRVPGVADAKGYKKVHFEEAWAAYLPTPPVAKTGQGDLPHQPSEILPSNRPNADSSRTSEAFSIRPNSVLDGSENDDLAYGRNDLDAWTAKNTQDGEEGGTNHNPPDDHHVTEGGEDRSCRQCDGPLDGTEVLFEIDGEPVWLHPECRSFYLKAMRGGASSTG